LKDPAAIAKTCQTEFVEDISVRGMIYALTIRSPVARGRIKGISCPKLPNSYYLITAAHIPGKNELADFPIPILADKKISYIGEPIAILAGPDVSKFDDLASKIELSLEEETPVFSGDDVIVSRNIRSGDPDKVFAGSDTIITGKYTTGIQAHWYTEPHGAVAVPSPSLIRRPAPSKNAKIENIKVEIEDFRIYTASQWPFHVKRSAASVLGLDKEKIGVYPTLMTEHMDGKIWYPSLIACQAVLAAWIARSPVKLMLTLEEDFINSPKRNSAEIKIQSSLDDKGEITASAIQVKLDLGAEGVFQDEIIDRTCLGALGVYQRAAFSISGRGIRTNIPPQGPMAGFGLSQGFFAAERHISRIADSLGQDPAEWRKKNITSRNRLLPTGITLKEPAPIAELIDAAAAMSDYYRKWASYELLRQHRRETQWEHGDGSLRGIGISTAYQGSGFLYNTESGNGNCTLELTLDKDGVLEIKTTLISTGTGFLDTWRELAHDILGVDPALIRIVNNTQEAPDSGIGTLSRNIGPLTRLMERCCMAIRKQRFRDPLPITVKRSLKPAKAPGGGSGTDNYFDGIETEALSRPSWGAVVVEIEIDTVSLEPVIRGIWLAVDGGKILSQRRARRTLRSGIIQALGWTYREHISYRDGKIRPELYIGYDVPAPAEIPPINVDFIWNDTADPKGIGNLPFHCVPAAYVQAVSQAMDHPFEKIPLDARDVWEAEKQKRAEPLP